MERYHSTQGRSRMTGLHAAAIAGCLVLQGRGLQGGAGGALAQSFPTRPLRLVVPVPPGAGADFVARAYAQRLNAEFVKAANSPELIAALAPQGTSPTSNSPEEFASLIRREQARFAKIVKDSGARAD